MNEATLGAELHDLSKLIGGQQRIMEALSSREGQLKDLLTNWNVTTTALAAEQANLGETVRELPEVLEAARPALDNLNRAFPSTRAWALEMIPGVRETAATIEAGFPWVRQTYALLGPSELQGLVDDLQPAVDDFAQFVDGQVELLPVFDLFNRCQHQTVLPSGETVIQDGPLTTGVKNYQEFLQTLVGLVGAGRTSPATACTRASSPAAAPTRSRPAPWAAWGAASATPPRRRSAPAPRAAPSRRTGPRRPATAGRRRT